jgi:hypothetical protein
MLRTRLPISIRLRPTRRGLLRAIGFAGVASGFAWAGYVLVGPNRHTVIPGRVYRCSQPGPDDVARCIDRYGIKTIVNLRGYSPEYDWYRDEARATAVGGISQEDVTLSANRLPPPTELRRLVEILDRSVYPILVHCKQGADRTGMVSAMSLLLYTDASLARARRELWPIRGHVRFGRTAAMDAFFDRYEAWLVECNESHSPDRFRDWLDRHYSPGPAVSELTLLDTVPESLPSTEPLALRVRVTNRSAEAWEFTPGSTAGIHLLYSASLPDEEKPRHLGRAGLFRRTVRPGDSVELTMVFPPLKVPGTYLIKAEMVDYRGAGVDVRSTSFVQFGSDPLTALLKVK